MSTVWVESPPVLILTLEILFSVLLLLPDACDTYGFESLELEDLVPPVKLEPSLGLCLELLVYLCTSGAGLLN